MRFLNISISHFFDSLVSIFVAVFLFLSLTISFALGEQNNYGAYFLLLILVCILLFSLIRDRGKISIKVTSFYTWILLFIFCGWLSIFNAKDLDFVIERVIDLIEIFIMIIVFYIAFQHKKSIDILLKIGMWVGYSVSFYTVFYYGYDNILLIVNKGARISNDALNANTVGLCAAQAILINSYYFLYKKKNWTDILILPAIFVLIASGSRKALLAIFIGLIALYCLQYINNRNKLFVFMKIFSSLFVLMFFSILILQLPIFDGITLRIDEMLNGFLGKNETDHSTEVRMNLVQIGWNLFLNFPILGIGLNNPQIYTYPIYHAEGYYLHNNYLELLCGVGIIGTCSYYLLFIKLLKDLIKYRDWSDPEYIVVLILLLGRLFLDIGMVSYEMKLTYFYLLLIYLKTQLLKKKYRGIRYVS